MSVGGKSILSWCISQSEFAVLNARRAGPKAAS